MLRRHIDRIVGILTISALIGWWISIDMIKKSNMGYDGYLVYEGSRYHRYIQGFHDPLAHSIGYSIFIAVVFVVYELIAYIFRRIFRTRLVQSS